MNGTAGLVLNGYAHPEHVQTVLAEYLLDSPALLGFITKKVESTTELTNRQRDSRLRKRSAEIAELEKGQLAARKAAALAQLEREFAGKPYDRNGHAWTSRSLGLCAMQREPERMAAPSGLTPWLAWTPPKR